MKYEEFKKVLKNNGLNLKKFSESSGVKYDTCVRWGKDNRPVSDWVESWLNLYVQNKNLKEGSREINDEEYKELIQLKELLSSVVGRSLSNGI